MAFSALLDLLFPTSCVGCGAAGEALCSSCRGLCLAPQRRFVGSVPCWAVGAYDGVLRTAVLRLKRGRRDVGAPLGALLAERAVGFGAGIVLVPAPTVASRRRERGFDQAVLLARAAARGLGCPVVEALRRVGEEGQRGASRERRLAAVGRFVCRDGLRGHQGSGVILVDDVLTTGATLRDAAFTLKRSGVRVVGAVVVAVRE